MEKKKFYTELAYLLGLLALALGAALMEKADFGMSMVVAPAYLLYARLSQIWSFVTFGMMEYLLQAALLLCMILLLRKFRIFYLFSFITAILYGFLLDGCMALVGIMSADLFVCRLVFYISGVCLCSIGVAFMFHTYIAPEVYELIVKEIAAHFQWKIHRVKTCYDCLSCLTAVILSFAFFGLGRFEGVKLGTILCAFINGWLIGRCGQWMERHWDFQDAFPLRRFFVSGPDIKKT